MHTCGYGDPSRIRDRDADRRSGKNRRRRETGREGAGGLVGGANSEGRDSAAVTHGRLSWRAGGSRTAGHPMGDDAACVAMVTGLCPGRL